MAQRGVIFKDSYLPEPDRSWFDLSFDNVYSCNLGEIIPTLFMETMGKDVIHQKSDVFARLAPLVAPAFGKLNMFNYHFYVRNRDIWSNWKAFMTNADQREAWQQNVSFIPPVMPYLDIRKILYNSKLFGKTTELSSLNTDVYKEDSDGVSYIDLDDSVCNYNACYILDLWYEDQGGTGGFTIYPFKTSILFDPDHQSHMHHMLIRFIPNKSEFHATTPTNYKDVPQPLQYNQRYNPFSNGSLFDFLGVDIEPVYKTSQQGIYNHLVSIGSKNTTEDGALLGNFPFTKMIDAVSGMDNGELFGINVRDFLLQHAALSITLFDSTFKMVQVNLTNTSHYNSEEISGLTLSNYDLYYDDESAKISALPLRAYYFIYSEYFRDQNYVSVNKNVDFTRDGEDIDWNLGVDVIFDYLTLKTKCWEHDPYTSALPGPQRGNAVRYLPNAELTYDSNTSITQNTYTVRIGADGAITGSSGNTMTSASGYPVTVDLSAATIENFRFANATQRFLEKVARTGNRYYEYMLGIFGVDIPDAKLDRPVYLGGDKTPIQVSEVLQTSASELNTSQPLGQMAGRGVAIGSDDYLEYEALENGFFVEVTAIIPRVSYQQGLAPMFTRKVQLDYPIPDYAQLGEEPILQGELYYSADQNEDETVFGFTPRYSQWKYNRDVVHGEFKSSLDHWTFARKFDSAPVAGKKFLEVNPDYRQFAVTDPSQEHVYVTMWHDLQVKRSLPIFGIPSL